MGRKPFAGTAACLWGLCAGSLLLSFCLDLSALPGESLCWFYNLTHLPCPGCGLTRAFLCISHGQWGRAWGFNPCGFIWYSLAWYGLLRPLFSSKARWLSKPLDEILKSNFFVLFLVSFMFMAWILRIGRIFF